MSKFFEFLVFLDVDEELGQSVENELSLIDEDINFILQELLTVFFEFFGHGSTEHHNLLIMRSLDENLLNVGSHSGVTQNLVALVDDEEFAFGEVDDVVSGQIFESTWSGNNDVWVFIDILELRDVVFKRNTTEICAESKLRLFEISA